MKILKKILKLFFVLIAVFLILLALLAAFTQTAYFRALVVNIINQQAKKYLTADFSIDKLDGNFYNALKLHNIILSDKENRIITIPEISINYNIRKLLDKKIEITNILMKSPTINLTEENGLWNINSLIKEKSDDVQDTKKIDWHLKINKFAVTQAAATIKSATNNNLPDNINNLNFEMSMNIDKDRMSAELSKLTADIKWKSEYSISLTKFETAVEFQQNNLRVEKLLFEIDNKILNASVSAAFDTADFKAQADIKLKNNGSVKADISFEKFTELQNLNFNAQVFNLDLADLLSDTPYRSNLNFNLNASCSDIIKSPVDVNLIFSPSKFFDLDIDELNLSAAVSRDISVDLELLRIVIDENIFEVKGLITQKENFDLSYSLTFENIYDMIQPWTDILETFSAAGKIDGRVKGKLQDLTVDAELELKNIIYDDLTVDEFNAQLTTKLKNNDISVNCKKLDIFVAENLWRLSNKETLIEYSNDSLSISNFVLSSKKQKIGIDGIFAINEMINANIKITDFDVAPFLELLDTPPFNSGLLDLNLEIRGSTEKPEILADILLKEVSVYGLKQLSLAAKFNYSAAEEIANGIIILKKKGQQLADIIFNQPMKISTDGLILDVTRNGLAVLKTKEIDLDIFNGFNETVKNLSGKFQAGLKIKNPFSAIKMSGNAKIFNGGFYIPELGVRYRDLSLDILFSDNKFELKKVNLQAAKGGLNGFGTFIIDGNLTDDSSKIDLRFEFNNFPVMTTSAADITANSRLNLSGSLSNPVFGGFVNILKGRINLDHFTGNKFKDNSELPLLLQAKKNVAIETDIKKTSAFFFDLTKLKGELPLKFDRNFWVRNADMNIELNADMNIIKRTADFEFFGEVKVIRGFYVFFGKKFQMEKGEIFFSGGKTFNPEFLISAVYSFRGSDMTRKKLKLLVSGKLDKLDITFELNNQPIEKTDAIAYLLFGRTFDKLSHSEKSEATDHTLVIGGLLANKLAEHLTTVVGDKFQFDQLEFSGDAANAQIGVEAGKYLTDELFISFKKNFNLRDTDEQIYEEIMIEYKLTNFLYLQAVKSNAKTTGIDLIWRFQWK